MLYFSSAFFFFSFFGEQITASGTMHILPNQMSSNTFGGAWALSFLWVHRPPCPSQMFPAKGQEMYAGLACVGMGHGVGMGISWTGQEAEKMTTHPA